MLSRSSPATSRCAIFFNIFGGITRCDEVARGILQAVEQMGLEQPIVVRLDGTNAEEGRRILERPRSEVRTRRRRCSTALAARWSWRPDGDPRRRGDTRLVVQGLTGSEGRFHGLRNRSHGTDVVAGVTPGKGGQDVEGIPIFDTVAQAVSDAGANTAMVFVPAPFAADAMYEAIAAGIETVICITEGVPAHEMLRLHSFIQGRGRLIGPNCPERCRPGRRTSGSSRPRSSARAPSGSCRAREP